MPVGFARTTLFEAMFRVMVLMILMVLMMLMMLMMLTTLKLSCSSC